MTGAHVRRWVGAAGFGLALLPGAARAHLVATGLGPLYDGAAHFALSPEDYVPIAGAALLAGLRGEEHARPAVLILPLAWLSGGLLGWLPHAPVGALGLVLGYANGQAMVQYGQGLSGVLGSTAAIFVFVSLIAVLAAGTTVTWMRIAWRVLGSWIAASGLLLLGWALRRS